MRRRRGRSFGFLGATAVAAVLVAGGQTIAVTLAGAGVIGVFLPMLGTYYSLVLDDLVPAGRRAEAFAFLRTSNALGVIAVSGLLAGWGLQVALIGSIALISVAFCLVSVAVWRRADSARG